MNRRKMGVFTLVGLLIMLGMVPAFASHCECCPPALDGLSAPCGCCSTPASFDDAGCSAELPVSPEMDLPTAQTSRLLISAHTLKPAFSPAAAKAPHTGSRIHTGSGFPDRSGFFVPLADRAGTVVLLI